jgi:hypothetical protein
VEREREWCLRLRLWDLLPQNPEQGAMRSSCFHLARGFSRARERLAYRLSVAVRICLDEGGEHLGLRDQAIAPVLCLMLTVARVRGFAAQRGQRFDDGGCVEIAHQATDELHLPPSRLVSGEALIVKQSLGQLVGQRQSLELRPFQSRKRLSECLKLESLAFASSFADIGFVHGAQGNASAGSM